MTRETLIGTSLYLLSSISSNIHEPFCSQENLIKLVFYLPREWSHRDDNRATRNFFVHIDSISGKKGWKKKKDLGQREILSRHRILFFGNNKESVVSPERVEIRIAVLLRWTRFQLVDESQLETDLYKRTYGMFTY